MVGGDHQQDGGRILRHRQLGCSRDGGRGITALRLQDDGGLDAAGARLLRDDEAELGIGDDHRRSEQSRAGDAVEHLLERRRRADQRDELLPHLFARHRPQARAGAAAQYHRDNNPIHHSLHSTLATLTATAVFGSAAFFRIVGVGSTLFLNDAARPNDGPRLLRDQLTSQKGRDFRADRFRAASAPWLAAKNRRWGVTTNKSI
jgi:hypothetical protein